MLRKSVSVSVSVVSSSVVSADCLTFHGGMSDSLPVHNVEAFFSSIVEAFSSGSVVLGSWFLVQWFGGSVGGCGARVVSPKTPIYFIQYIVYCIHTKVGGGS